MDEHENVQRSLRTTSTIAAQRGTAIWQNSPAKGLPAGAAQVGRESQDTAHEANAGR
jgi:hypothetical protein